MISLLQKIIKDKLGVIRLRLFLRFLGRTVFWVAGTYIFRSAVVPEGSVKRTVNAIV